MVFWGVSCAQWSLARDMMHFEGWGAAACTERVLRRCVFATAPHMHVYFAGANFGMTAPWGWPRGRAGCHCAVIVL
jgi:hypothetical protein